MNTGSAFLVPIKTKCRASPFQPLRAAIAIPLTSTREPRTEANPHPVDHAASDSPLCSRSGLRVWSGSFASTRREFPRHRHRVGGRSTPANCSPEPLRRRDSAPHRGQSSGRHDSRR
ncbi:ubiquitin-associated (UBA)/TS-N domain-containing protein [Zea mays]|uniref:Ubiquitin-associated (UBA)/TS-N domain-containing protein n=1 Tax=Zea mays TaxID=4577 RepID=A0A1D6H8V6_MAIZE|nr:ubiquitin-associated (UBA)/TS-N domain-containing protein [Zea mays]